MEIVIRKALESDINETVRCYSQFMEHHIRVDKRFTLKITEKETQYDQV